MSEESPPTGEIVPVLLDTVMVGIEAERVIEVAGGSEPAELRGLGELVLGIVPWRGRGIAAIDTRRWMKLGRTITPPLRWVIVRLPGGVVVALAADAVREVCMRVREGVRVNADPMALMIRSGALAVALTKARAAYS